MATDQAAPTDVRTRREEALAELEEEHGAAWRDQFAPGTLGLHELLDRVALLARLVDMQILDHPACVQNEQWYLLADSAAEALNTLYQELGTVHLGDESAANG